jgi:hypothetical protein
MKLIGHKMNDAASVYSERGLQAASMFVSKSGWKFLSAWYFQKLKRAEARAPFQ